MGKALAKAVALAAVVPALVIGLGASPTRAHNDWGLPLVGGLAGGYGLSYLMNREKEQKPSTPTYAAPAYSPGLRDAGGTATVRRLHGQLHRASAQRAR